MPCGCCFGDRYRHFILPTLASDSLFGLLVAGALHSQIPGKLAKDLTSSSSLLSPFFSLSFSPFLIFPFKTSINNAVNLEVEQGLWARHRLSFPVQRVTGVLRGRARVPLSDLWFEHLQYFQNISCCYCC